MSSTRRVRRVLFILPDLAGGGAERTNLNLQRHLDPVRFCVDIALLESRGEYLEAMPEAKWIVPESPFLRMIARRASPDSVARALPQAFLLRSILRRHRPDVVMSSMADVSVPLALAWKMLPGQRRRTRWIAREGNNTAAVVEAAISTPIFRRAVTRTIALTYGAADTVVTPCTGVAEGLVGAFGISRKKIAVIGNPVDLEAIAKAASLPSAIAVPKPYIVGVGRLAVQKGFDLLVRAFAALKRADLQLAVLGTGPEERALRELGESLGVGNRLHLPGFLANPWPVVAGADVFCLPSRWEGFGHVIVEAMACGTPLVVAGCPYGPAEIVRPGVDGLVVRPSDWQALKEGLAAALDEREAARRRAAAGRLRATDFAAPRIAQAYGKLFDGSYPGPPTNPHDEETGIAIQPQPSVLR